MQPDIADKKSNVIHRFNEIFLEHLNRLTKSRYGIEELVLNPLTVSIITLLMERQNEIESSASHGDHRYTRETLIEDIIDMGFSDDQDMDVVIGNMIQKNYIQMDGDRLMPQKPVKSMAGLMDLIFPNMPGMNLIAYFIQTLDEVKTNRKDIDSAADQFNQMLQMQGVPLEQRQQDHHPSTAPDQPDDTKTAASKPQKSPQDTEKPSQGNALKTPFILGRKSKKNLFDHTESASSEPKVLSATAYTGKTKITKLNFGETESTGTRPDEPPPHRVDERGIETSPLDADTKQNNDTEITLSLKEPETTDVEDQVQGIDASAAGSSVRDAVSTADDMSREPESAPEEKSKTDDSDMDGAATHVSPEKSETAKDIVQDTQSTLIVPPDSSINDDDIEKRISDFEEDLALECPICRQSKLQVHNTATGKSYYKCSNKECSFISWGKPHHIICPKCRNPFLIEASNRDGTAKLKCPRATCRYWKKLAFDNTGNPKAQMDPSAQPPDPSASMPQKSRRRVVRRRVVRKKR